MHNSDYIPLYPSPERFSRNAECIAIVALLELNKPPSNDSIYISTYSLPKSTWFQIEGVVLLIVIMKCFSQKPTILTLLAGAGAASLILSIMAAVLRCHRGTEAALTPRCPADRQQCPDPPDCWHWTLVPQLRQLYLHSSHIQDRKCSIAAPILSVSSLARSGGYITSASTKIQLNVNLITFLVQFILTSGSGIWPIIWLLMNTESCYTVEKKKKTNLGMVRVEMKELKIIVCSRKYLWKSVVKWAAAFTFGWKVIFLEKVS